MDMTALFDLSYGVYVVGALDGNRPVGCVANSAMQITAEPMTMAVSLNKKNFTEQTIKLKQRLRKV
jgi:flavin reductase (DIM6/NTAB) family NADH-FMN oxidoreductase RutF